MKGNYTLSWLLNEVVCVYRNYKPVHVLKLSLSESTPKKPRTIGNVSSLVQ